MKRTGFRSWLWGALVVSAQASWTAGCATPAVGGAAEPRSLDTQGHGGAVTVVRGECGLTRSCALYSMADLQALADRRAWHELLQHIEDISPTERDAAWEAVVMRAIAGSLVLELASEDASSLAYRAAGWSDTHPFVRASSDFVAIAETIALRAAEECSRDGREHGCPWVARLVRDGIAQTSTTVRVAERAAASGNRPLALELLRALTDDAVLCDHDLALSLAMEGRSKSPDSAMFKDATAVRERCAARKARGS